MTVEFGRRRVDRAVGGAERVSGVEQVARLGGVDEVEHLVEPMCLEVRPCSGEDGPPPGGERAGQRRRRRRGDVGDGHLLGDALLVRQARG
ncbi:hypothetical protein [Streptomyces sp. NPDC056670]|uniref:hypothetical protein n=1 Tax=Streptomyces sp. NPDC056670 TaxID=3345904 RepID=UPI00368DBA93